MLKISSKYIAPKINVIAKKVNSRGSILAHKKISQDINSLEYKHAWSAPKEAVKYNYAAIVNKSDSSYLKEVMTFFNEEGKVIGKIFRENGLNKRFRKYTHSDGKKIIDEKEFDTSKLHPSVKDSGIINMCGTWRSIYREIQKFEPITYLFKKGKNPISLKIKHIEFSQNNDNATHITLTRFPLNFGLRMGEKEVVSGTITRTKEDVVLSNFNQSNNLNLKENDPFLKYRFLDPHTSEGMIYLTKEYLRRRGIDSLKLYIIPNFPKIDERTLADFFAPDREIRYYEILNNYESANIVGVVAHEVEHAHEHFMIGRLGKGKCEYEIEALQKYGQLKDSEEIKEARLYSIASDKYPKLEKGKDYGDNPEYKYNYLELVSNEAKKIAQEEYQRLYANYEFFEDFV